MRRSRSTAQKRRLPDGWPPPARLLTCRGTRSTSGTPMPRRGCPSTAPSTGCARSTVTNPGTSNCAPKPAITVALPCTPTLGAIQGCSRDQHARHGAGVNVPDESLQRTRTVDSLPRSWRVSLADSLLRRSNWLRRGKHGKVRRSFGFAQAFGCAGIFSQQCALSTPARTGANSCSIFEKLGVTGSSPAPPTEKGPGNRLFFGRGRMGALAAREMSAVSASSRASAESSIPCRLPATAETS
jgi:hypothetical protein